MNRLKSFKRNNIINKIFNFINHTFLTLTFDLSTKNENLNKEETVDSNSEKNNPLVNSEKDNKGDKASKRLFKFDNIKGLAICLIVFLHISSPFFGFSIYHEIGKLIIPIGMGLFCFVSGYFSKVDENTQIKALKGAFIPYILFCTLWIIFGILVLGYNIPKKPYLLPTVGLWYLLILFYFRLALPALIKVRHIFWISLAGALFIGLINVQANFLALTRAFAYLPIFLAGYYFKNSEICLKDVNPKIKNTLFKIRDWIINNKMIVSILLLLFIIVLFFIIRDFTPSGFFGFKLSYAKLKLRRSFGMAMRLFGILSVILVAILMTYVMPNKRTFLSNIGANSLYVYVLHFYISQPLKKIFGSSTYGFLVKDPLMAIIFPIIVTLLLVFLLSSAPVKKVMDKLISITTRILIKDST